MPNNPNSIRVWDPLIRLFHWSLVIGFFLAYITEDDWQSLHVLAGYTVFGLVLFRLIWGLVGSRYARFGSFVRSPATTLAYLKDVIHSRAERHLGHNPAGGAMIVALLTCLLTTTLSGMALYGFEEFSGPLADAMHSAPEWAGETLKEVHEFFANFTLFLVALHVAGVLLASLQHGENLIRSMITGRKQKELP